MRTITFTTLTVSAILSGCVASVEGIEGDAASESSSTAAAATRVEKTFSCKPDHRVDAPAQITSASAASSRMIQLSSTTPSDASGYAVLDHYRLTDAAGSIAYVILQSVDSPSDFTLELLAPGTTYSVEAGSIDGCGNLVYSSSVHVTTPADGDDTHGPTVDAIIGTRLSFFAWSWPGVLVHAIDGTSVDHVELFVNGESIGDALYNDLRDVGPGAPRGWSDSRGEAYYQELPQSVLGTTATIRAVAYDVLGNVTETTSTLAIPAN